MEGKMLKRIKEIVQIKADQCVEPCFSLRKAKEEERVEQAKEKAISVIRQKVVKEEEDNITNYTTSDVRNLVLS